MSTSLRNKLLLTIFLCLIFVISFGVCYSFVKIKMGGSIIIERDPTVDDSIKKEEVDKRKDKEEKEFVLSAKKKPVVLKSTKAIGALIIQTYEFTLNGDVKSFTIEYTKSEQFEYTYIKGQSYDGIELVNLTMNTKGNYFTTEYIDRVYGTKYMEVIRGEDGKEYLVVMSHVSLMSTTNKIKYYIFDQNGKCINRDEEITVAVLGQNLKISDEENMWYKNDLISTEVQSRAKIEDNKIHVLKHVHEGDCLGKIEERIYTIVDGSLKYTTKKNFEVAELNGTCSVR